MKRSDLDLAYYINDDAGVKLHIRVFKEVEYVGRIEFYLNEKDKKKFECKKTVEVIDNSIAEAKEIKSLKTASKIKFTSVYTKLSEKTCKEVRKPKSDEDEVPLICTGYQDYKIFISTHNVGRFYVGREISATDTDGWITLELPSFVLNAGLNQTVEWRLADGEPFACIVRSRYDRRILDADAKGTASEIIVQNLRGFAPISISIDANETKRADKEARRRADAGYGKL